MKVGARNITRRVTRPVNPYGVGNRKYGYIRVSDFAPKVSETPVTPTQETVLQLVPATPATPEVLALRLGNSNNRIVLVSWLTRTPAVAGLLFLRGGSGSLGGVCQKAAQSGSICTTSPGDVRVKT